MLFIGKFNIKFVIFCLDLACCHLLQISNKGNNTKFRSDILGCGTIKF